MEKKKMTKEAAIELLKNKKVYVNGRSKEIQEKLFELGFEWVFNGKEVICEEYPFIMIGNDNTLYVNYNMKMFSEDARAEISAEEILAIEVVKELKENDVVVSGWYSEIKSAEWISLVKEGSATEYEGKVALILKSTYGNDGNLQFDTICETQEWTRPATEEEKQKLIDALKLSSDGRAKHILKEVLDIEDCPFKPFDKVLVRDKNSDKWRPFLFWKKVNDEFPYVTLDNVCFSQCVLYEGHEHLLGTTKSPEE